jgi:hypothetical protein
MKRSLRLFCFTDLCYGSRATVHLIEGANHTFDGHRWETEVIETILEFDYKNGNYWYGVTNPALDMMFGTFKNEKDVPRSETAKQLIKKEGM